MQDEVLTAVTFDIVIDLFVKHGTERNNGERLRFPAGKHCGTVRARQYADFTGNGADIFQAASVNPQAFFQYVFAQNMVFHVVE